MSDRDPRARAQALVSFYETLNVDTLQDLRIFYTPDCFFKDPFNEVRGLQQIERIFQHMFANLTAPRFCVLDCVVDEQRIVLTWDFHFFLRSSPHRAQRIHGASLLRLNAAGLVLEHRDYWDAAGEVYASRHTGSPGIFWKLPSPRNGASAYSPTPL